MSNSPPIEKAIRETVPGSKWYYQEARVWREVTVERVTKTVIILTTGARVGRANRFANGITYFPPTPEMVSLYETQQLQALAWTRYWKVKATIEAVATSANPTQLNHLVTQLENVLDLLEVKP